MELDRISNLIVKEGLPKSHTFITTKIGDMLLPGIIWDEKDIIQNGELSLYRKWATVHFASPWYEIEAQTETDEVATQRDIHIIQNLLGPRFQPPVTIIDIHCGSGRHAIDLAKRGFQVVGMEEVEEPIQLARNNGKKERIPAKFVLSTNENHKKYAGTADIVISMFNSLGYTLSQEEDQEQFNWAIRLLKPGGLFVLDIRSHDFQKKKYQMPRTIQEKLYIDNKEIATMFTTKFWQHNKLGAIEKIISENKTVQYTTYGWNTYAPDVLRVMLEEAGAKLLKIHADYYGSPKDLGERIFVVAQKKND